MKSRLLNQKNIGQIDGAFKKGAKKFQASFYGLDGKKLKFNNNDDVKRRSLSYHK